MDSMITGSATRLLVGYHVDEDLGPVTCNAYFNLGPDNTTKTLEDINTTYSRIELVLAYDKYSYYDTTAKHTFYVHRLTKAIEAEDDGYLYNTSSVAYDPEPLGQLSFTPYPHRPDSLEIPLDDEFGLQLYELSKHSSNQVLNAEDFRRLLRGLVIKSDTSINGAIFGFTTDAELRLYYVDRSIQPTDEKYLSYSIKGSTATSKYFNAIKGDRGKTSLASLKTRRYSVTSDVTNNRFYVQGGGGLLMRIELPYIRSIMQDDENMIVSDAYLEFKPVHNSSKINCALPEELIVYSVNGRNELLSQYGSAKLIVDKYLGRDSYYYLDVEPYVKQQLAIDEFNKYALLLQISDADMASSVTRLYAGDQHGDNKLQIALHVVTVNVED
jgi:hypothetical protein